MTDLPVEERRMMALGFLSMAKLLKPEVYYERGFIMGREYSKQREEKLREEAIRLATLLHFATHDPNFTLENCTRLECRNRRAALAENGDSEPVGQWHESRSGLLDRFCEIDTSDWDEGDFFHFLEKPWQSQYEIDHPRNVQNKGSVPDGLGDRRPGA